MKEQEQKSHPGTGRRGAAAGRAGPLLLPLLILLAAPRCGAAEVQLAVSEVSINPGLLWIMATETVGTEYAAPGPVLTTLGASLPLRIWDPFFVEPMLDFWMTTYEYTASRAVPTEYETNKGFLVLAALLSLQAGARWTVAERMEAQPDGSSKLMERLELGGALGFDFLFRLPLDYNGGTATTAERTAGAASAVSYFYGAGRFFYPETRFFASWRLSPGFGVNFNVRALWPLFHAWDGEGLPFYDQMQIAGNLGFTIYVR